MIAEKTYVTIHCDTPGCQKELLAATVTTRRNRYEVHELARKAAQTKGWHRVKVEGQWQDLCPLCYEKLGASS